MRHVRSLRGDLYVLSNMARNVEYNMKDAYPELTEQIPYIQRVIRAEEERFARTIDVGLKKLEEDLDKAKITSSWWRLRPLI